MGAPPRSAGRARAASIGSGAAGATPVAPIGGRSLPRPASVSIAPTRRALGSGAAASRSWPSRLTSTLPPEATTQTVSPSRIGIVSVEDGGEGRRAGRLENLLHPLDREPQATEDRRVVDDDHVVEVPPAHRERPFARERRRQAVGDGPRLDPDRRPGVEGEAHRVRAGRLDAVDAGRRPLSP